MAKPYHSEERLRKLYHEKGMSLPEMAEEFGVDQSTIHYHMEKNGIPRRRPGGLHKHPEVTTNSKGYKVVRHTVNGNSHSVRIHRLLAVSEWGIEAVSGMDVHHKNGCKIDNRVSNLEVISRSEHLKKENSNRNEKLREWGKKGAKVSNNP